jgi:hypothetical protein
VFETSWLGSRSWRVDQPAPDRHRAGRAQPLVLPLNLRAPCRSTLADANTERPAAGFRDIALALILVAAGALQDRTFQVIDFIGADGGTRTRTRFPGADFKSAASTVSPRPRYRNCALKAAAGR